LNYFFSILTGLCPQKLFFMRKFVFCFLLLMGALMFVPVVAQDVIEPVIEQDVGWAGLGLSSFTGIVAIVALVVTQIAKLAPIIESKTVLKILISAVVGVVISFFVWNFSVMSII
jgi:hypothetical protein